MSVNESSQPVTLSADCLLHWLERLSTLAAVHHFPEVHDAIVTAIFEIRGMTSRGEADQPRVDELFRNIVAALDRKRLLN